MDELVSRRARASKRGDAGASVQGFDAERGVLALHQSNDIATIKLSYGGKVVVGARILTVASAGIATTTFHVTFSQTDLNGNAIASGLLDFADAAEFGDAIKFVSESVGRILADSDVSSEFSYRTKDGPRVGIFRGTSGAEAFLDIGSSRHMAFMTLASLSALAGAVTSAIVFLRRKGAVDEGDPD